MSNDNFDRDVIKNAPKDVRDDLNADPITGEPGAHPVGTGVGAAGRSIRHTIQMHVPPIAIWIMTVIMIRPIESVMKTVAAMMLIPVLKM